MKQKIGTILFAILVVCAIVCVLFYHPKSKSNESLWQVDTLVVRLFEDSLIRLDSLYEAERLSKYAKKDSIKRKSIILPPINRHPFDPNTADSIELLQQGFKPWQVRTMKKYRAKGGRWRRPEDLLKMYNIDTLFFDTIRPFIVINDTFQVKSSDTTQRDSTMFKYALKKDTIIELNTADTTSLKLIRGIGSYLAKQIVRYRDELGGYCDVSQLLEIKAISSQIFDKISQNLTVDKSLIRPININHASVSQMSRHPYMRAEQAKQLYDYRRTMIRLKDIHQIEEQHIFNDEQWEKIKHYIIVE